MQGAIAGRTASGMHNNVQFQAYRVVKHAQGVRRMDVQEILARVQSDDVPGSWDVWRLRNDRVSQDIGLFVFGAILGLFFFGLAFFAMIPGNFQHGIGPAIPSFVLLVVLAVLGFGSLAIVIQDVLRLRRAKEYLLIMTPDDFVKVEPGRITQVPMDQIRNLTLKGVKVEKQQTETPQGQTTKQRTAAAQIGMMGWLMGAVARQPKVSPSLAFLDSRTDTEVVVSNDNSFGDLTALQDALSFHMRTKAGSNPM